MLLINFFINFYTVKNDTWFVNINFKFIIAKWVIFLNLNNEKSYLLKRKQTDYIYGAN